jgi:hypothetical protein
MTHYAPADERQRHFSLCRPTVKKDAQEGKEFAKLISHYTSFCLAAFFRSTQDKWHGIYYKTPHVLAATQNYLVI